MKKVRLEPGIIVLIAVIVALSVLILIPPAQQKDGGPKIKSLEISESSYLGECTDDFFTKFKSNNVLADIVRADTEGVHAIFDESPENVCFELEILREDVGVFYHADNRLQEGCDHLPNVLDTSTVVETLQHDGQTYAITLDAVYINTT